MPNILTNEDLNTWFNGIFSNYCGPGGSGKVLHRIDSICKKHDEEYGKLQKRGINPYLCYNKADEIFLHDLQEIDPNGYQELVTKFGGKSYFKLKQLVAPYCKSRLRGISQSSSEDTHHSQSHSLTETDMAQAMINHKKRRGDPIEHSRGHEQHNMEGAPEEGGEDQITKPHHIWRRFPNTQTASLKWVMTTFGAGVTDITTNLVPFDRQDVKYTTSLATTDGTATATPTYDGICTTLYTSGVSFQVPKLYQVRMTSPYNILKQHQSTSMPITAGFQGSSPTWLSYFDSMYQYYHCMETEWEITLHFGTPVDNTSAAAAQFQNYGLYIFWRYTEQDDPPISWASAADTQMCTVRQTQATANAAPTTDTITATQLHTGTSAVYPCTPDDYFRMGGWHHKRVVFNTTHPSTVTLEGSYKYGQCKMDLKTIAPGDAHGLDTTAEGWAQTGATPVFPENLSIIIVQDNAVNAAGTYDIRVPYSIRYETEQLIQFKDLRANLKFPTPELANSLAFGHSPTPEVFFIRGAANT